MKAYHQTSEMNKIKISEKKIDILYKNLLKSISANFVCATIVFFVLLPAISLIWYWFTAVILISILRLIAYFFYQKNKRKIELFHFLFLMGLFFSASLWGIADSLLMPSHDLVKQMVVIIIIAGISAGGIHSLNASLVASLMYTVLIIPPLCIWLMIQATFYYLLLGVAMIIYFIFMLVTSVQATRLLEKTLTLDNENLLLIDNLLRTNKNFKQHEYQILLINKMTEMLQLCKDSNEAYDIIINSAKESLSEFSGGLIILDDFNLPTVVGEWGEEKYLKHHFSLSDCWALRKGSSYHVSDSQKETLCYHFINDPTEYICIPIIIQSKIVGILVVYSMVQNRLTEYYLQIAHSIAEAIQLSLANIKLTETLYEQSIHDPLTGLLNRRYLNDTLKRELQRSMRENTKICVAMIDLDHFKKFNDENGHKAGDEILKFIGSLLNKYFRKSDLACRYGGEEFLIALINSNLSLSYQKLEKFRNEIKDSKVYFHNKQLPICTVSIGVAEALPDETIEDLIHASDKTLYLAKQLGRDRTEMRSV